MKVICIDDSSSFFLFHQVLKFGEIYETCGECKNVEGRDCYILPQLPPTITKSRKNNALPIYLKKRFIPLSSIDETEFERNYKKEELCQ